MSPLLPEKLEITLSPERVWCVRRSVLSPRPIGAMAWNCKPHTQPETDWHSPLQTLRENLPQSSRNSVTATVVVSNHYCNYLLLAKNPALTADEEILAYARHKLTAIYGDSATDWELRLAGKAADSARVVSALDPAMLEAVRAVFAEKGIRLASLQPHLAIAFNRSRAALQTGAHWFVMRDHERLLLCLFSDGQWRSLTSRKAGEPWIKELYRVLDREQQLLGTDEAGCNNVLLYAPEVRKTTQFKHARYSITLLETATPHIPNSTPDGKHALAT